VPEHVAAFEKTPSISLVEWPSGGAATLPHYGATFLWMLYLHEQHGGVGTIVEIVQNRGTSLTGVADVLVSRGVTAAVSDIFIDWKLANYLSNYRSVQLSLVPRRWHRSYSCGTHRGQLRNFSADAIGFAEAGGLTVGFSTRSGGGGAAHAIEYHKTGDVRVRALPNSGTIVLEETVRDALLVPSLQQTVSMEIHSTSGYEYSAVRGVHITFVTTVLPNPVQQRSWDIVMKASDAGVGMMPAVTLLLSDNGREQLYSEAQPMSPITRDSGEIYLYRFSFLLEPEITPESVKYQISLDDQVIDIGELVE